MIFNHFWENMKNLGRAGPALAAGELASSIILPRRKKNLDKFQIVNIDMNFIKTFFNKCTKH